MDSAYLLMRGLRTLALPRVPSPSSVRVGSGGIKWRREDRRKVVNAGGGEDRQVRVDRTDGPAPRASGEGDTHLVGWITFQGGLSDRGQGFPTSPTGIRGQTVLCWGAVLCIVGCLAASWPTPTRCQPHLPGVTTKTVPGVGGSSGPGEHSIGKRGGLSVQLLTSLANTRTENLSRFSCRRMIPRKAALTTGEKTCKASGLAAGAR